MICGIKLRTLFYTALGFHLKSTSLDLRVCHEGTLAGLLKANKGRGLGVDLDKEQDCCMQILHCITIPDFSVTKVLLCYSGKMLFIG